jgi:putative (di)nucleoside polyphosphate hydrolase
MSKDKKLGFEQRPYRRGVGIVLFNDEGEVFVAQRIDNPGPAWQMPQGGIDRDENPIDAAWRELHEETGISSAKLLEESRDWLRYDLPAELADRLWKGRYRGQEQMWYAFRFTGEESEIKIDGPHPEFSAWKWAPFAEVPKLIVPFKRPLYERVFEEFRHLAD